MNKVGQYLQEHLIGEVVDSAEAIEFFSTDMSIFRVKPGLIVYPRNENDVRKTARFSWQLAERGRIVPITARGAGTDLSGAAIGDGVVMVLPAHLHHILDIDNRSGVIVAEPGANFAKVQQALEHAGRFLPPAPASAEYSTIGGAVMNNAGGEASFKYGNMRNFVRLVRLVLANGEVIDTGRVSKRELNKKLGLSTFEGEIYRALDTLIEENQELIKKLELKVSKNNAGYALNEVKRKDGSFDLTPLMVGSQGTLGIISEVTIDSETYSSDTE
ncbi:MAG: FAD-binding oxidoreductase, partial [Candidatus Saccharimonadales bacterium]